RPGPTLMQEIISCPSCQRKLQVPDSLAGQDVQCPTCGATFVASAAATTVPPADSSAPTRSAPPAPAGTDRAPLPDRPPRRRIEDEDEDDYDADRPRRRRRDLLPHRGAMILTFGILSLTG